nr:uncharacterized protein LOC109745515 [Aegilops tauschii subsp. strangulata]
MPAAWTPPPARGRIPSPTPGSASSDLIHPGAHADARIRIHGFQIEAGAHRRPPLPSSVTDGELGSGRCASGALWWCLQYVGMPAGVRSGHPCAMSAAASPTSNLPSTSECGSPPLRLLLLPPTSLRCRPVRPRLLRQQPNSRATNGSNMCGSGLQPQWIHFTIDAVNAPAVHIDHAIPLQVVAVVYSGFLGRASPLGHHKQAGEILFLFFPSAGSAAAGAAVEHLPNISGVHGCSAAGACVQSAGVAGAKKMM